MAEIYWPFATTTVSEWPGTRPAGWANHVGTDFAIPQGTPLKATMAGTVDIHWTDGLGAWVIDIINPDGTVVRNGHLSYMAVADGEWVNVGDYIGNTGGAGGTAGAGLSTGPHLHWEIRNNTDWGAWGWYDPRNLDIRSFAELSTPAPSKPAVNAKHARLYRKQDPMIRYYEHANGKGKPGWLVMGVTPNALVLSTQASANEAAADLGTKARKTSYEGFMKYLRSANPSKAQLDAVSRG